MTSVLLNCYCVEFSLAMISAFLAPLLRGEEQGSKSPFSLLSEPISPSSLLFEPISLSSLNVYLTFSPSSILFPPISPSSQLFLGHFSLLPILFLPPLYLTSCQNTATRDYSCLLSQLNYSCFWRGKQKFSFYDKTAARKKTCRTPKV